MYDETHWTDKKLTALEQDCDPDNKPVIQSVMSTLRPYWNVF
jgi:hypothetical protein